MSDPFEALEEWLAFLDSHDGRLHRRARGGNETDCDIAALLPTPPGQTILTVGQLREIVRFWAEKGK